MSNGLQSYQNIRKRVTENFVETVMNIFTNPCCELAANDNAIA